MKPTEIESGSTRLIGRLSTSTQDSALLLRRSGQAELHNLAHAQKAKRKMPPLSGRTRGADVVEQDAHARELAVRLEVGFRDGGVDALEAQEQVREIGRGQADAVQQHLRARNRIHWGCRLGSSAAPGACREQRSRHRDSGGDDLTRRNARNETRLTTTTTTTAATCNKSGGRAAARVVHLVAHTAICSTH